MLRLNESHSRFSGGIHLRKSRIKTLSGGTPHCKDALPTTVESLQACGHFTVFCMVGSDSLCMKVLELAELWLLPSLKDRNPVDKHRGTGEGRLGTFSVFRPLRPHLQWWRVDA